MTENVCPRCGLVLVPPGMFDTTWRCSRHGSVLPLHALTHVGLPALNHVRDLATVPVWTPAPMPAGWRHTGLAMVGDSVSGVRGTVTAFALPNPLGGEAEILVIAEEMGVGVGAAYAGWPGADESGPADIASQTIGSPHARISVLGRTTPLWSMPAANDRCAYVGEAAGVWLWIIASPPEAGYLLLDSFTLGDARLDVPPDLDVGPLSLRLRLPETG